MKFIVNMISTNYPLYSVVSLGNGQVAIAGGGGACKTGVPNALVSFVLTGSRVLLSLDNCFRLTLKL